MVDSISEGMSKNITTAGGAERMIERIVESITPIYFSAGKVPIAIEIRDFDYPSIGSKFAKVRCRFGDLTEDFVVKYYYESGNGAYQKLPTRKSRASTENSLMKMYRNEGFESVPKSFMEPRQRDILYMKDVGDIPAERKLRENPDKQKKILQEILLVLSRFHAIGKRKGFSLPSRGDYDRLLKSRNFNDVGNALLHHYIGSKENSFTELREDFRKSFSFLGNYLEEKVDQIIHGDLNTYHIIFNNGNMNILDLEKAKLGHVTQDLAGLLCSPEVKLSSIEAEELLKEYKREYETFNSALKVGIKGIRRPIRDAGRILDSLVEVDERVTNDFIKTFYYSAVFECFRRCGKMLELKDKYPETYRRFVARYPGYINAETKYSQKITEITGVIKGRKDKLFSEEEEKRFIDLEKVITRVFLAAYLGNDAPIDKVP